MEVVKLSKEDAVFLLGQAMEGGLKIKFTKEYAIQQLMEFGGCTTKDNRICWFGAVSDDEAKDLYDRADKEFKE